MGNGGTTSASARRSPRCAALLLIDIINPFDFDDGDILADNALASADAMLRLRDAADALEAPVIYVNDNYGRWNSDNAALIEGCARHSSKARELIEKLRPRPSDYFVIKPQFSGFYATNLPVLLPTLGVSRLVLTGVAGDICVLFTAADAHMRDYDLWAPEDAVASTRAPSNEWALELMRSKMGAETRPTRDLTFAGWLEKFG